MYSHEQLCTGVCSPACGCGMMSVEDEIRALEVQQAHLKLQQEMIGKRIAGLRQAGT